ncbi:MAG: hypothetical protein KAR42_11035 [candidate division Zixibacteria bacterium]|nr:hypothetical protein [candidate division Zixibacteria bacterium]
MIKLSVSDVKSIQRTVTKELEKLSTDNFVTVGIHEDTGNHPDSGMTNATLGAIQHFGNDHIPARPWLDVGVESGNAEYLSIIKTAIEDQEPLEHALNRVGVVAVGRTQQYMTQLRSPSNAESTITRKGSANPLIDTGELRASVNYKLQSGKPEEGIE